MGLFDFTETSNAGITYPTASNGTSQSPFELNQPVGDNYYKSGTGTDAKVSVPISKPGMTWEDIIKLLASGSGQQGGKPYVGMDNVTNSSVNSAIPFYPLPQPAPQGMQAKGSSTGEDMAVISAIGDAFGVPTGGKK